MKIQTLIKICKTNNLITTIRYCLGSVDIQQFPSEFIPIIPFSIRFYSNLYLSPGKIRLSLSRLRPDSTECNRTEIRQWPDSEPTLTEVIRSKFVGKLGMIGYCRNVILSLSALSHCKRLCLVSVVLHSVIVGTLTWVSLTNFVLIKGLFRNGFGNNGSQSIRSGCNLNSICRKQQWQISPDHSRSTGHRPEYTEHR